MAAVKFFLVAAWYMHMKHGPAVLPAPLHRRDRRRDDRVRHRAARVLEHGAEVVGRPCSPTSPSPPGSRTPTSGCSSALLAAGYALAIDAARAAPRARRARAVVTRFQVAYVLGGPARAVGRLRLADPRPRPSATCSRSTWCSTSTYSIIAAPLLLIGTPAWLARWLLSPRWLLRTVRYLSRLIPATISSTS